MLKYIECTGKNEEEAIAAALRQLGLDRDEVSVEVLERAKSGFLGIGGSPAKIKVTYEVPDEPVPVPVVEKKPASTAEKEPDPAVERAEDTAAPADLTSQTTAAPEELGDKAESIDRFLTGLMATWRWRPLRRSLWGRTAATRWSWWVRTWGLSSGAGARRWTRFNSSPVTR